MFCFMPREHLRKLSLEVPPSPSAIKIACNEELSLCSCAGNLGGHVLLGRVEKVRHPLKRHEQIGSFFCKDTQWNCHTLHHFLMKAMFSVTKWHLGRSSAKITRGTLVLASKRLAEYGASASMGMMCSALIHLNSVLLAKWLCDIANWTFETLHCKCYI